jgi:hypothetical protein
MSEGCVYLSGPISLGGHCTPVEIAAFSAEFAREALRLRKAGYRVVNPCELDPEPSWEAYMRHGMRAVADADIVAVLPRWAESRGASLEVFVATQLKIRVAPVEEIT